jgi:hypothetical protein
MEELQCEMCGVNKPKHVLALLNNPEDEWPVCDECAAAMLHTPELVGIWQKIGSVSGLCPND